MIETPLDSPLPGLRDRAVRWLLLFVLALQLWCWHGTEGYQLADSVEFMERARSFVRGEAMVDATAIRPFGFSTVLVPFFYLADLVGLEDPRRIVWAITVLQILLGLGVVCSAVRVGSLLAGRRAGLLAGLIAGTCPVLLQYSTQPVSGLAAGLLVGFAVEAAIVRHDFRGGLKSGLLFAAAFLMAYQSLLIAGIVALLVLVRGRWRERACFLGIVLGVLVGVLLQAGTDWIVYGRFGASLVNHFVQNAGFMVASFLIRIGWDSLARPIYDFCLGLQGLGPSDKAAEVRSIQSGLFYVVQLPRMLVWPAIAGLLLGFARCVARPSWRTSLLALTLVLNVLVMSNKSAKDFRLWLPLLPILAPLCAYGWTWLAPRRALDAAFAASVLVLGLLALEPQGSKRYATYWRAMEWVNERARASDRPLRVASAYHWAVFLRERANVELVKLPRQVHLWSRYPPEEKAKALEALDGIDVFLGHLPVLTSAGHEDLLAFLAERFEVMAAVHDQEVDLEGLGPILVLGRRSGRPNERLLYEFAPRESPRSTLWPPVSFVGNGEESLVLEDWRYETLPPQGLGWLTLRWTTPTGVSRDYLLLARITAPDLVGAWQSDRRPAWNRRSTDSLAAGETWSEGCLVVPATDAYVPGGPYRPIGGSYRHGDSIPATLWAAVLDFDPEALARGEIRVRSQLAPRGGAPLTPDGLARVGRLFLPLPIEARLP